MPSHPVKHHFVPQFLLKYFAGQGGQLYVHQWVSGRAFPRNVKEIGQRKYGHSIYQPGQDPDHSSMEAAMGDIEGQAATVVKELVQRRERAVPQHAREALAWLLALQWQRSRFLRHVVSQSVGVNDYDLTEQEVQSSMMRLIAQSVIWPWQARNDEGAHYKDQWNHLVSVLLSSDMHWSCYRPRGGGLVVSDNPLCMSGIVGTPPADIPAGFFDHGVGIGFTNFRRITVPLGSSLALVISRDPNELSRLDVAAINRFTVFNSREFVAHSRQWKQAHPKLARELPDLLERQQLVAPAFLHGYKPGTTA
ncbi:DUF4238 domain-containing protein [Streptomyces rochei]|uniref:DUF4238 domain-containing protein n=1 Tax=Streptomyces rochei TaxID=1928 RepID=UPI0033DB6D5D